MNKVLSIGFAFVLVLILTACGKWEGNKKEKGDYYYSLDYREAEGTILGIETSEIDILYSVFWYEEKQLCYKLVIEEETEEKCGFGCGDKSGDLIAYEEGTASVDNELNITFIPKGSVDAYSGYFENEKKNYKVVLPGAEVREINFIEK